MKPVATGAACRPGRPRPMGTQNAGAGSTKMSPRLPAFRSPDCERATDQPLLLRLGRVAAHRGSAPPACGSSRSALPRPIEALADAAMRWSSRVPVAGWPRSASAAAWPTSRGALGLPVVLVVGVRLGCLNHALLSDRAIRAVGPAARRLDRQRARSPAMAALEDESRNAASRARCAAAGAAAALRCTEWRCRGPRGAAGRYAEPLAAAPQSGARLRSLLKSLTLRWKCPLRMMPSWPCPAAPSSDRLT